MTLHWSWGLTTALLLALVIHLNGRGVRAGWLLGAAVQVTNLAFGYVVYGQWTFLFLAIPAAMFLVNWWRHPRRVKPSPLRPIGRELTEDEIRELTTWVATRKDTDVLVQRRAQPDAQQP